MMKTMRYVVIMVLVGCGSAGAELSGDAGGGDSAAQTAPDLTGSAAADLSSAAGVDLAELQQVDMAQPPGPDMAACGMWKQPCCGGNTCNEQGTVCYPFGPPDGQTPGCFLCGGKGQLCCANSTCAGFACQPPGSANEGKCE